VPSLFDTATNASLDAGHRVFVNYESFFFAGDAERRRFLDEPTRWCGWLTDPVTMARFLPDRNAPTTERDGRIFYFASDSTEAAFAAHPDSFAAPHTTMIAMRSPTPMAR